MIVIVHEEYAWYMVEVEPERIAASAALNPDIIKITTIDDEVLWEAKKQ